MKYLHNLLTCVLLIIVFGCAIYKKEDETTRIRNFMKAFEEALIKGDKETLKFFRTQQSNEIILPVIDALRNANDSLIHCMPDFKNFEIIKTNDGLFVKYWITFQSKIELDKIYERQIEFVLTSSNDSYFISQVEAQEFYSYYNQLQYEARYNEEYRQMKAPYLPIYEQARKLESKFDSVV